MAALVVVSLAGLAGLPTAAGEHEGYCVEHEEAGDHAEAWFHVILNSCWVFLHAAVSPHLHESSICPTGDPCLPFPHLHDLFLGVERPDAAEQHVHINPENIGDDVCFIVGSLTGDCGPIGDAVNLLGVGRTQRSYADTDEEPGPVGWVVEVDGVAFYFPDEHI